MKLRTTFFALGLALLCTAGAHAASPDILRALPADSAAVAGVDADRVLSSPFGQFLRSRAGGADQHLAKLIELTGFDPRRDLREIVFASRTLPEAGKRSGMGKGVVFIRGNFDAAKLTAAASTQGAALDSYKGVTIFALHREKPNGDMAALLASLAIAGPAEEVRAAIDRYQDPQAALPPIATQAAAAANAYDAWAVAAGSPSRFAGVLKDPNLSGSLKGDLLQGITQTSGGVRFGANIEIGGEAVLRSAEDATALLDVYKFLMSMVQLNAPKTGPASAPLQSFLGSLQVAATGNVVKFTGQLPQAELEKLITRGRLTTASLP
ncbi:MAG: hypothetical protein IT164_15240 [Bryobacterales bacterium]|nr:hypothetical protein [Bryobacterales bacterium]